MKIVAAKLTITIPIVLPASSDVQMVADHYVSLLTTYPVQGIAHELSWTEVDVDIPGEAK
jgi:hypothetical protein